MGKKTSLSVFFIMLCLAIESYGARTALSVDFAEPMGHHTLGEVIKNDAPQELMIKFSQKTKGLFISEYLVLKSYGKVSALEARRLCQKAQENKLKKVLLCVWGDRVLLGEKDLGRQQLRNSFFALFQHESEF